MAEAESVLPERPKMASSIPSSRDDVFHTSSTPETVNRAQPTLPPSSSPALPETSLMTNGSILTPVMSSPMTAPAKTSTLRKSSGKKKPSKLSKDVNSKHSKKTFRNSPDQSERDNGECPYSDLDSVPKILCPKALERQPKLTATQPSVTVVKEAKKQPETQSGLWFSKSGKDRRPKTTSPMPDRSLFSKVPCKKKNSSVVSKKTLVPGAASSSGGSTDQSGLLDKQKSLPAETVLPPEPSGHLRCKNSLVANRPLGTTGSPADQSGLSDKQRSMGSVETRVPSDQCGYSKSRKSASNTSDTVTVSASDQSDSSDGKKASVSFKDQPRFSESVKSLSRTEHSDMTANKKVYVTGRISDRAAEEESKKTSASSSNVDTTEPSERLEKQTSLVSKCRLPFVKLIRKDMKGKKVLNSSVTISPSDQPGCPENEKTPDTSGTKMSSIQSDCVDRSVSVETLAVSSEPLKVSVKKLKASGGTGVLHLSSESSQEKAVSDEFGSPEAERRPILNVNPTNVTSSYQSEQSEGKETPASDVTNMSSDQSGSSKQKATPATGTAFNTTSVCGDAHVPEGLSAEKSKKVHKPKQVPDKVSKVVLHEQPAHLPASSRLMTRALKAMQEAEQKKRVKRKEAEQKERFSPYGKGPEDLENHSAHASTWSPEAKRCTKINSLKSQGHGQDTFSSCSTPPLTLSESADFEADVKSEDEDLSISSTPPMDFIPLTSRVKAKKEDQPSDTCSSSSPSSPFAFMNAFKNVEEVSFQSLTSEGSGKPVSFKADANYKFSTFLMMLKDLHDTREREGTPLELEIGPPSAHVKEEPLVMPGETRPTGQDQLVQNVNRSSSPIKIKITHRENSTSQTSKRPYNRRSSSSAVKKKANRKVPCRRPARSGPGFPGLESSPAVDSSLGMESRALSLLDIQTSSWERQAGGGEGVVGEGEVRWSRVNENLQNVVPLEQKGCDTTQNGLDCTQTNTSLMHNAGGGDKAPTGESSSESVQSGLKLCLDSV